MAADPRAGRVPGTGDSRAAEQKRSLVKVTRIYTDPDSSIHAEEYEPPRGTRVDFTRLQFSPWGPDYFADWHPVARRQYVVTVSGERGVEIGDGRKIRLDPGHPLLVEKRRVARDASPELCGARNGSSRPPPCLTTLVLALYSTDRRFGS